MCQAVRFPRQRPKVPVVSAITEPHSEPAAGFPTHSAANACRLLASLLDQRLALGFHLATANRQAHRLVGRVIHPLPIVANGMQLK